MLRAATWLRRQCGFVDYSNSWGFDNLPPQSIATTLVLFLWWRMRHFTLGQSISMFSFIIPVNMLLQGTSYSSTYPLQICPLTLWPKCSPDPNMTNLWRYSAYLVTVMTHCHHSEGECWDIRDHVTKHVYQCIHIYSCMSTTMWPHIYCFPLWLLSHLHSTIYLYSRIVLQLPSVHSIQTTEVRCYFFHSDYPIHTICRLLSR